MKKAFLKTCALALSLLLATLLLTACGETGETSNLVSMEDAEKFQVGMHYHDVVDILGSYGFSNCANITYIDLALENGQYLRLFFSYKFYSANVCPEVSRIQIYEDPSTLTLSRNDLPLLRCFCSRAEYDAYAAQEDWSDPLYANVSKRLNYAKNFIYASALDCLGSFSSFYVDAHLFTYLYYYYDFVDANDYKMHIEVCQMPNRGELFANWVSSSNCAQTLPEGMTDMTYLDPAYGNAYYRDGLLYRYNKTGRLNGLQWCLEARDADCYDILFTIQAPFYESYSELYEYPMDGQENTLLKRLLSADDTVAASAFTELKTHITTHNTKPVSYKQVLIGVGITVLIIGIGVAVLILLKKKRAAKSNAPETPDTALESTAPSPEIADTALESTAPSPEIADTDLESTAPSPEVADTATDGTAPLPETPQNE